MNLDNINIHLLGLGELSPELRDDTYYSQLASFIKSEDNDSKMNEILLKKLVKQIENTKLDMKSVLQRSFSALCLSHVIFEDYKRFKKLESDDIKSLFQIISSYFEFEVNKEEKNQEYGWVHCHAHAGDVLTTLIIHHQVDKDLVEEICQYIKKNSKDFKGETKERIEVGVTMAQALKKVS
jgi:hypothetical protein